MARMTKADIIESVYEKVGGFSKKEAAEIVETVFNVPGLGQLMVRAVLKRDYFTVQGITLFFSLGVVMTTFLVDLVSVALDPRVKM